MTFRTGLKIIIIGGGIAGLAAVRLPLKKLGLVNSHINSKELFRVRKAE